MYCYEKSAVIELNSRLNENVGMRRINNYEHYRSEINRKSKY